MLVGRGAPWFLLGVEKREMGKPEALVVWT